MAISWSPSDILVICVSEADIEVLTAAGYQAILEPGPEEFGPMPKAGHYIVVSKGGSFDIANELVASGVCPDWQVSVNHLGGYQDLTHAAEQGGVELVREILRKSKSLYEDEAHPFIDVHKPENVPSYLTGWPFFEPYIRWTLPEFGVFCGPYAGGKSALAQMLACDWADQAGRLMNSTASICAWEDAGWRVKRNIERFAVSRESDDPRHGAVSRTKDLLRTTWRITRRPGELRDIGWYLQRCEMLVKRENCRFFVFDPWNEHDEIRDKNDSETQYVNKMLRELREFTAVHDVIMIVVTHISGKSYDEEGRIRPFRVAQAHGSSHFGKKCDRGLAVWVRQHPHANIGIATGRMSGFLVIDLDPRSGSNETLAKLAKAGKVLGDTAEAGSPRDGRHLYFAYDPRVTTSKANALGAGIDVKTDGGYIVAPPSFWRGNGQSYRWLRPPRGADLPRLPQWAILTLQPPPQPPKRPSKPIDLGNLTGYRRQALADLGEAIKRMATLSDGRHEAPFKVASALGKYVTHKLLTESDLETAVMDACSLNGALRKYSRNDLLKQVRNGLKKASGDQLPPLARVHGQPNQFRAHAKLSEETRASSEPIRNALCD